ncbi:MAG TPA: diacylglycerol kinase family protein [Candidatus Limnocylindrales bacterium]
MAAWLIVNPRAGGGRGAQVLARLVPLLRARGVQPTVHVCADGGEPESVARAAVADGAELIVAIGGDGHAGAVAQGVLGSAATLGVVPAGSANDYARALGVRGLGLDELARLLAERRATHVDVMRVESAAGVRHVLTVGGTGFDAVVAERAMRIHRLRGAPRYVAAMLAELPRFAASDYALTLDGERRDLAAMLIAVAKGDTYGGGMRVAPQARLQSGWLELCVVGEMSRLSFLRAFPSVFRGSHVSHPKVTMLRAREVAISALEPHRVLGDGELIADLPVSFKLLPRALAVVAGPRAALA